MSEGLQPPGAHYQPGPTKVPVAWIVSSLVLLILGAAAIVYGMILRNLGFGNSAAAGEIFVAAGVVAEASAIGLLAFAKWRARHST